MSADERTLRERVEDACMRLFRQEEVVALLREQQAEIERLTDRCALLRVIQLERDRDAYKKRMEALKEYAQHTDNCMDDLPFSGCTCGLDALLAACERGSER